MLKMPTTHRICGLCLVIVATAVAARPASAKGKYFAGKARFLHRVVGALFRKPHDLAVDPTQDKVFKVYGWKEAISTGRLWEETKAEVVHDLDLVKQRSLARDQAEKCHTTSMFALPQLLGKPAPSMTRKQLRQTFINLRKADYNEGYQKVGKPERFTYPKDMVNAASILGLEADELASNQLDGACEAFLKGGGHDALVVLTPKHWTVVARHPKHGLIYFDPMQDPIKVDAAQVRELVKRAEPAYRSIGVYRERTTPRYNQLDLQAHLLTGQPGDDEAMGVLAEIISPAGKARGIVSMPQKKISVVRKGSRREVQLADTDAALQFFGLLFRYLRADAANNPRLLTNLIEMGKAIVEGRQSPKIEFHAGLDRAIFWIDESKRPRFELMSGGNDPMSDDDIKRISPLITLVDE